MIQTSYLPVICQSAKPPPKTAAADFIGTDKETTHRWLCKGQSKNRLIPASEWICSHLASACGLPVPPVAVVAMSSNLDIFYFGSQWQGGAITFPDAFMRGVSNPEVFLDTYAVDLFVHNTDRHYDNYLYLDLAGDVVAKVIDFSHALMVMGWPLPDLPMNACHTTECITYFLSHLEQRGDTSKKIISSIENLPSGWMAETIKSLPESWLTIKERDELHHWWVSPNRQHRLDMAQSSLP